MYLKLLLINSIGLASLGVFSAGCSKGDSDAPEATTNNNCGILKHGESEEKTGFSSISVPYGESCETVRAYQKNTCNNGILTITESSEKLPLYPVCISEPAKSCEDENGGLSLHGTQKTLVRYTAEEVAYGESCEDVKTEITATCNDGSYEIDSKATFETCKVKEPLDCGDTKHGESNVLIKYRAPSVSFGQSCELVKEVRTETCENGTLVLDFPFSPGASYDSCQVETAKNCGDVKHGESNQITKYRASLVPYGSSCEEVKETRTESCNDGTLSLDLPFSLLAVHDQCGVEAPRSCGDTPHGGTVFRTRYFKETVPHGQSCEEVKEVQSATCSNGDLRFSGTAQFESCLTEAPPVMLPAQPRDFEVYISPDASGKERLETLLSQAEHSIYVSMYSMSDTEIRNMLVKKAKEGVKVLVLFNKKQCDGSKKKSCDDIEAHGGNVRFFSKTNHQKFAVIDHEALFDNTISAKPVAVSGSGNWSSSAFTRYDDDMIVFHSESDVKDILAEFKLIWPNARPWSLETTEPLITLESEEESSGMNVFTSGNFKFGGRGVGLKDSVKEDPSTGVVQSEMVRYIDSAKVSVKVATAHFRLQSIYDALLRARARGVEVKIVTDQQEFQYKPGRVCEGVMNPKDIDECLAVKGFDIRWKTYMTKWDYRAAKQMHLKYITVDDLYVLTGSFNFSETAETSNLETLHILTGEEVVRTYKQNFEKISNYGYEGQREEISRRALAGEIICQWTPLTLSFKDYSDLRRDLFSNPDIHDICSAK